MIVKPILVVYGTRPEVIKLAPVIHELKRQTNTTIMTCSTGQHRELTQQMLTSFGISSDINLDVMAEGQSLEQLTVRLLTKISALIEDIQPHMVIVQGDTTTAYAAALAAFYKHVPVAHVEAGLRTYDMGHPFPEEFNRQSISKIAHWHFAPSAGAKANLEKEGVPSDRIWVTGNTSIDALLHVLKKNVAESPLSHPYILLTTHRRENQGEGLMRIAQAVHSISFQNPHIHFLVPLHPNPKVRGTLKLSLAPLPNVHLVDALSYVDFITALKHCLFVLSDSGGVQEEAPSLGKPVLVLRETTEREEAIDAGTAKLVGTCPKTILTEANRLLADADHYASMSNAHNPYGTGRAARHIAKAIFTP